MVSQERLADAVANNICCLVGRGTRTCCSLHEQVPPWLQFTLVEVHVGNGSDPSLTTHKMRPM